jgi:hypothetical protein
MYKGMLCNMAAFKQHCAFMFWHRATSILRAGLVDQLDFVEAGGLVPGADA